MLPPFSGSRSEAVIIMLFLRRHKSTLAIAAVTIPLVVGLVYALWRDVRPDESFYRPGVTPSREDCVLAKMKPYAKIDRMTLQSIAPACELPVNNGRASGRERVCQ